MLRQIIDLNPVEPARMGFRQARGAAFSCTFLFKEPGGGGAQPAVASVPGNLQLVFRPHSDNGAWPYDIVTVDPTAGTARVEIDGAFFNDPKGYTVEMYTRDADGRPLELIALGEMRLTGGAYEYTGPLGPMTLPAGVQGPAGPAGQQGPAGLQGIQGIRGSMWFTGHGGPTIIGEVEGDMYLDVDTGDVWRWVVPLATWERAP
jgi:hypothetical protein